ncbi:MAG: hypothetical protein H7Z37_09260 [Pyrinomonadaceae bacterium]|nr:hypothetical protein [Pyrinomonadaceae bacterium]
MTSDGTKFCVAIPSNYVEEKYRRFACGTNAADYTRLRKEMTNNDSQSKQVRAFSSLRPQHFTDALLMREAKPDETTTYLQSEIYQEETDTTKPSTASARVIRGYYLLDELKKKDNGELEISRRFWFDRVGGIRLARQQIFDNKSAIESDIGYGAIQQFGADRAVSLPVKVEVTRPKEKYKVSLTYQSPQTVTIGQVFDPQVFQLINKWNLPEVKLDETPTK